MSHTLLSLIDTKTGQPLNDVRQRLGIFQKMLDSGIPKNFFASTQLQLPHTPDHIPNQNERVNTGTRYLNPMVFMLKLAELLGLNLITSQPLF